MFEKCFGHWNQNSEKKYFEKKKSGFKEEWSLIVLRTAAVQTQSSGISSSGGSPCCPTVPPVVRPGVASPGSRGSQVRLSLQQAAALGVLLLVCGIEQLDGLLVDQSPEVLKGNVLTALYTHLLQNLSQTLLILHHLQTGSRKWLPSVTVNHLQLKNTSRFIVLICKESHISVMPHWLRNQPWSSWGFRSEKVEMSKETKLWSDN